MISSGVAVVIFIVTAVIILMFVGLCLCFSYASFITWRNRHYHTIFTDADFQLGCVWLAVSIYFTVLGVYLTTYYAGW